MKKELRDRHQSQGSDSFKKMRSNFEQAIRMRPKDNKLQRYESLERLREEMAHDKNDAFSRQLQ